MEMTSTAATSASNASHFGRTATSASQVPRTTEAAIAVAVPQPTAESSAARPDFIRYVAAIARISFPFWVSRRRYSRPLWVITSSRPWPSSASLHTLLGVRAVAGLPGCGLAVVYDIVYNDNRYHYKCQ